MQATEKARAKGIPIRAGGNDYRTPCPECSPKRSKPNQKVPCLHVTIGRGELKWHCFHCEFKGILSDDDERRFDPRRDPSVRKSEPMRPARARGW